MTVAGNTIAGNWVNNGYGGGVCCSGSQVTISNTILWDNLPDEIGGSATVTYSDVQGGYTGTGNIDADPLFIDPANGDYRLQQHPCQPGVVSPCVDTGDPSSPMITGTTRTDLVQDTGIVDMGFHYDIASIPGVPYCHGDPGAGTTCPCGNDNDGTVPGSGCANGIHAQGARLTGSGIASVSNDTLVLTAVRLDPNNTGLYFQADNDLSPGLIWGDGLRCAGGNLVRLEVAFAGEDSTSSTSVGISAKAGNVQPGDTKYYQCWYRNPLISPCGSDFNATNGYAISWTP